MPRWSGTRGLWLGAALLLACGRAPSAPPSPLPVAAPVGPLCPLPLPPPPPEPPPEALPEQVTESGSGVGMSAAPIASQRHRTLKWSGPEDASIQWLVLGSSSIYGPLGKVIVSDLAATGARVGRLGVSGTGLSRRDHYDWLKVVQGLPLPERTLGAVVYLGVNDAQALVDPRAPGAAPPVQEAQPTASADEILFDPAQHLDGLEDAPARDRSNGKPRRKPRRKHAPPPPGAVAWRDAGWVVGYEERAVAFVDALCERGVERVVLLLPVDVRLPNLDRALHRVRAALVNAAVRSKCGVAVATAGDAPRFILGRTPLRRKDGYHMTVAGAQAIWSRVRPTVMAAVGR